MFSNYQYALSSVEKTQIKTLRTQGIQPTIIAIYDILHGTTCADKAVDCFMSKGVNVVKVSSAEGLNHPIFKSDQFNGIYLTGGHNLLAEEFRTKFEGQLLGIATEKDLPLLGICRGLQTIGYHSGYEVTSFQEGEDVKHAIPPLGTSSHIHTNSVSPVVVHPGSQLYNALQYKFKNNDNKPIEYPVVCLHGQHLVGEPKAPLKVTGRAQSDGVIESVEKMTGKKYFAIAFQHHPEVVIDFFKKRTRELLAEKLRETNRWIGFHQKCIREAEESIKQTTQEETLGKLEKEIHKYKTSIARLEQEKQNISKEMTHPKSSIEEKAARAELGLFTKQVKKQFLEQCTQSSEESHVKTVFDKKN
jgi:gamma-glutamyl-gamma-aminobutyrate hydrolase PuuD